MNPLCQQYLDNLTTVGALSKPVFSPDAGQDQVLARIRGNAGEIYRLRRENDGLLEELRQGAGRRYAPRIVALLDGEALRGDLSRRLGEERQRIYCGICRELGRS